MENINEKPREYSNQELLDMVNETLLNSEYKDFKLAYRNLLFEIEAYNNQNNLEYLNNRKHYA